MNKLKQVESRPLGRCDMRLSRIITDYRLSTRKPS